MWVRTSSSVRPERSSRSSILPSSASSPPPHSRFPMQFSLYPAASFTGPTSSHSPSSRSHSPHFSSTRDSNRNSAGRTSSPSLESHSFSNCASSPAPGLITDSAAYPSSTSLTSRSTFTLSSAASIASGTRSSRPATTSLSASVNGPSSYLSRLASDSPPTSSASTRAFHRPVTS